MRLLRVGVDAVAIGAGTLRAVGGWTDVPADLAARSGGSRDDRRSRWAWSSGVPNRFRPRGAGSTPSSHDWWWSEWTAPAYVPGAEVLVAPTFHPEPDWLLGALHERGIRSVLLEGGPTVNARFHAAGLIDELFWTVGPWLLGGEGLPMIAPQPPDQTPRPATLVSVHRHEDELFLRYRFGADATG